MDVSLDEIIKRNKLSTRRKPTGNNQSQNGKKVGVKKTGGLAGRIGTKSAVTRPRTKGLALGRGAVSALKAAGVSNKKVSDLRLLIGGKKGGGKGVIRDAREKISKPAPRVTDARHKLNRPNSDMLVGRGGRLNTVALSSPSRRKMLLSSHNRGYHGDKQPTAYMDLEQQRLKKRSSVGSLLYRTVDNDTHSSLNLPDLSYMRPEDHMMLRHAQTRNMPLMSHDSWIQPSMQDITARYNIDRMQPLTRTFNQENVWAQPQVPQLPPLRSSLGNGVGSKRRMEREEEDNAPGYRIVVSNLQSSVTHEDIKELFEDIGSLVSSRVVRPGTAEVVYKNMQDAVKAVDTYHNRQLDGQPMKCLLVKPSNMSRLMSKGSVVPDLHAIHKALFNK